MKKYLYTFLKTRQDKTRHSLSSTLTLLLLPTLFYANAFASNTETVPNDLQKAQTQLVQDNADYINSDTTLSCFGETTDASTVSIERPLSFNSFDLTNPFQRVITLGSCCLPKSQILRFFDAKFPKSSKDIVNGNYLFDWMVPSDYTAFSKALDVDFKDVFGPHMEVAKQSWGDEGYALKNGYSMEFNHAFDGHSYVSHYNPKTFLSLELFHRYYADIERKFSYLTQKTLACFLEDIRTLYIVYASSSPANPLGQKQSDFINLMNSIKKKKGESFLLLVLVTEEMFQINDYVLDNLIEGNLYFMRVKLHDWYHWFSEESNSQWDSILNTFCFSSMPNSVV